MAKYWELEHCYTLTQLFDLYEMMEARSVMIEEAYKEAERRNSSD